MLGHMYGRRGEWDCTLWVSPRLVWFISIFKSQMTRIHVINNILWDKIKKCFMFGCTSLLLWEIGSLQYNQEVQREDGGTSWCLDSFSWCPLASQTWIYCTSPTCWVDCIWSWVSLLIVIFLVYFDWWIGVCIMVVFLCWFLCWSDGGVFLVVIHTDSDAKFAHIWIILILLSCFIIIYLFINI